MSFSLSATAKTAIYAEETSEVLLTLLTIEHASLGATPIRVVDNYSNITSAGDEYLGYPFEITGPGDDEAKMPSARLVIDNVDRQIVEAVRTLTGVASATMSFILASTPDTIERGPWVLQLRNVVYDGQTVSGDLLNNDIFNEPYPGIAFRPGNFPGLFP